MNPYRALRPTTLCQSLERHLTPSAPRTLRVTVLETSFDRAPLLRCRLQIGLATPPDGTVATGLEGFCAAEIEKHIAAAIAESLPNLNAPPTVKVRRISSATALGLPWASVRFEIG